MSQKTLFMENTKVSAEKTAGEITSLLVRSGAREVAAQHGPNTNIIGLRFILVVQNVPITFILPARTEPVYEVLRKRRTKYLYEADKQKLKAQAERVGWRQLLRWVQAQLALIDTGMVAAQEVFLPYMLHVGTGQTLFEYFSGEGFKLLAAPEGKR